MEWWYKCNKYLVNEGNKSSLQDSLKTSLRAANNLSLVNLYDDGEFYYIKTSNKMSLNHYLYQNGFQELDEDKTVSELNLLYGLK